jgi:hypothetical protein
MKRFLLRGTTALVGASAIAFGAVSVTGAEELPVSGAAGGYHSPAAGTLALQVTGRTTKARLAYATASVNGGDPVDSAAFCSQDPQADCRFAQVPLKVDTTRYDDGLYHLDVTIWDADGRSYAIDRDLEVWNHPPLGSPTATLNVGSSQGATPQGSGNGGASGGAVDGTSATSCKSPRLSMFLAQKPLRVSKGVPVLLKNKRYRFTGRLTCVVNGKRKSAARGAQIAVRNVVGGKTVRKTGTTVRGSGKITLILTYPSSRTIEFRYTAGDGKTSKVRIKVRIAQRKG